MNIVYFDNAATTKIRSEVLNEMIPYLTSNYGNASSLYSIGRTSKHAIDNARAQVASLINCNPNEIYFTSCGSESDNTALKGIAFANKKKGNHIITSKIEHPAILESCKFLEKQGFDISYINVDSDGFINLQELENAIICYKEEWERLKNIETEKMIRAYALNAIGYTYRLLCREININSNASKWYETTINIIEYGEKV